MEKTLYIFSNGELHRGQNTLEFIGESGKKFFPVEGVRELMIFGEVTINKKLLDFISQNEIILHFFNYYGYYSGSYYPREHYNSGYMILRQAEYYMDGKKRLSLAKKFVRGYVENSLQNLKYYQRNEANVSEYIESIENIAKEIEKQESIEKLMAIEGNIHEIYYKSYNEIIKNEDFEFGRREKRPPSNEINALISFANSMVYTSVLREIYKTHLDPRIGYLHTTNFRRFTLNLDVAEIFKPIIGDRIIFRVLNKGMIKKKDFDLKTGGIFLKEEGRKVFIKEFDETMQTTIKVRNITNKVSYSRLLRLELYKIEKHLMGEKEYEPYISRW